MIYRIEEKNSALSELGRRALLLKKIGCPVACTDYLPVDDHIFDQLQEGDTIEIVIKKFHRPPTMEE